MTGDFTALAICSLETGVLQQTHISLLQFQLKRFCTFVNLNALLRSFDFGMGVAQNHFKQDTFSHCYLNRTERWQRKSRRRDTSRSARYVVGVIKI